MTKINNKLFTVFLCLGIVFFSITTYLIFVSEILSKRDLITKHKVYFNGVEIVKNGYLDTSYLNPSVNTPLPINKEWADEASFIKLINLADSLPYVISTDFKIQNLFPPNTVEIKPKNSSIPTTILNNEFKIIVSSGYRTISEFPIGDLNTLLDLKHKKDLSVEKRDIKIISTDKKIIAFAKFTVDADFVGSP